MAKYTFVKNNLSWLLILAICIESCSNGENSRVAAGSPNGDSIPISKMASTSTFVGGLLDTLYVSDTAFSLIKIPKKCNKVVFSFVFGQNDTLTMHGWKVINNNVIDTFSKGPDILLASMGPITSQPYGVGTYFGNEILRQDDLAIIRDSLKTNSNLHYVLFIPSVVDNHIYYKIVLKDKMVALTGQHTNILVTNASANPSPPRAY